MTLKGRIHWTFLKYTDTGSCIIESQMTGRRSVVPEASLRYWRPGD